MRLLLLACMCVLASQWALSQSDINLDLLNDCAGLAKVRAVLDSHISEDCKRPRNSLETKMMSQFIDGQDIRACLLVSPPVPMLSRFTCIDLSYEGTRELACLRSVDERLLKRYVADYDLYRTPVIQYLNAAAQCPAGNGDATAAPKSVFPPVFKVAARANFGWVLGLGKQLVSDTRAYHGYADVDPEVEQTLGGAEVFDVFSLHQSPSAKLIPASIGETLKVETDDLSEAREKMSEQLGRLFNVPVDAKIRLFEFKYSGPKDIPLSKRQSDLDGWQEAISSTLGQAGFRRLTRKDLEGTQFRDPDDLGKWMIQHLPWGSRQHAAEMFSSRVVFRIDDRLNSCTRIGEVFVQKPEEDVRADYGGIAILLMDEGHDCDDAEVSSDDVIDKATTYLRGEVKSR
jgi:hypothetical protein